MVGRKQQQGARQGEDLVSALAPALGGDSRPRPAVTLREHKAGRRPRAGGRTAPALLSCTNPASCGSLRVWKPSWPGRECPEQFAEGALRRARTVACEDLSCFMSLLWKEASLCQAAQAGVLSSDPVEHICLILFFPSHFIFKNLHCFFLNND